jgi:hypothetical protein
MIDALTEAKHRLTIGLQELPGVKPLDADQWVVNSLLQKSIRRGEGDIAQRAALTVLAQKGLAIWRRFIIIAFEDVGIPVWSTTRVKSAIVLSLMVDGSGSRGCRILGRLRAGQDGQEARCHAYQSPALSGGKVRTQFYTCSIDGRGGAASILNRISSPYAQYRELLPRL